MFIDNNNNNIKFHNGLLLEVNISKIINNQYYISHITLVNSTSIETLGPPTCICIRSMEYSSQDFSKLKILAGKNWNSLDYIQFKYNYTCKRLDHSSYIKAYETLKNQAYMYSKSELDSIAGNAENRSDYIKHKFDYKFLSEEEKNDIQEKASSVLKAREESLLKKEKYQDGRLHIPYDNSLHLWELPSGKMNKYETTLQAAIREMIEETGISISNINDLRLIGKKNLIKRNWNLIDHDENGTILNYGIQKTPIYLILYSGERDNFCNRTDVYNQFDWVPVEYIIQDLKEEINKLDKKINYATNFNLSRCGNLEEWKEALSAEGWEQPCTEELETFKNIIIKNKIVKSVVCTFYNSSRGCRYGTRCRFLH